MISFLHVDHAATRRSKREHTTDADRKRTDGVDTTRSLAMSTGSGRVGGSDHGVVNGQSADLSTAGFVVGDWVHGATCSRVDRQCLCPSARDSSGTCRDEYCLPAREGRSLTIARGAIGAGHAASQTIVAARRVYMSISEQMLRPRRVARSGRRRGTSTVRLTAARLQVKS